VIATIDIDDLEPKFTDFGPLYGLIDNFPDIKITIFMPVNTNWASDWWRNNHPNWVSSYILRHPGWCKKVSELPRENVEIALHGYYHHTMDGSLHGRPEFLSFTKDEALKRLLLCEQTFDKAGIPFVRGFRPPRWEYSIGTIEALEELDYLFCAPDPRRIGEVVSPIIPQIYYNAYVDGSQEKSSPTSWDEYRLFRGHYHYIDHPLMLNYRKLVGQLRRLLEEEDVTFKFYTEIADDMRRKQNDESC